MDTRDTLVEHIQNNIRGSVQLLRENPTQYAVLTPYLFNDGDVVRIVLKQKDDGWVLSDMGNTLMRLTYTLSDEELDSPTRQKVISDALSLYNVHNDSGELVLPFSVDESGEALHRFIQAILRISDVQLLSREITRSTFMDDFRSLIESCVPESRRTFNWYDSRHDPKGNYKADCRINGMKVPLLVFGINNDNKTNLVTINLLQYERWGIPFNSLAIFEDQETIGRSTLARFSDVAGKQFSSLAANTERIRGYITEHLRSE